MLMRLRREREALGYYQTVIEREPANAFARFMTALALIRLNRHGDAKTFLEKARSELPDDPDISHALARLLAASPDDTMRDGKRALELLQSLWKGLTSVEFEYVETLAMAFAEAGRFEEAVRLQQDIIAKVESAGRLDLVSQLKENLVLYERRQACRKPWRDDDPVFAPVPAIQTVAGPQPQGMSSAPH
jgi:tetratricopeptide (TPR) repeat protein